MDPNLIIALIPLLKVALGDLGELIEAFIVNSQVHDVNEDYLRVCKEVVKGVYGDHPDWDYEQKRRYAFDAIKQSDPRISDAYINSVVAMEEMALGLIKN